MTFFHIFFFSYWRAIIQENLSIQQLFAWLISPRIVVLISFLLILLAFFSILAVKLTGTITSMHPGLRVSFFLQGFINCNLFWHYPFFNHHLPSRGHFELWTWTKMAFFRPPTTSSCPRSHWTSPSKGITRSNETF